MVFAWGIISDFWLDTQLIIHMCMFFSSFYWLRTTVWIHRFIVLCVKFAYTIAHAHVCRTHVTGQTIKHTILRRTTTRTRKLSATALILVVMYYYYYIIRRAVIIRSRQVFVRVIVSTATGSILFIAKKNKRRWAFEYFLHYYSYFIGVFWKMIRVLNIYTLFETCTSPCFIRMHTRNTSRTRSLLDCVREHFT